MEPTKQEAEAQADAAPDAAQTLRRHRTAGRPWEQEQTKAGLPTERLLQSASQSRSIKDGAGG